MMHKKIVSRMVLALLLTFPEVGLADAIPLKLGQLAPYDGLLLKPADVATIMAEKRSVPDLVAIEVKKAKDDADAQCKLRLSDQQLSSKEESLVLSGQLKVLMDSNDALTKQLSEAQSNAKWTPILVGGASIVGIAVGVLTTIVVTKTLN